jgi:hypothetical protein
VGRGRGEGVDRGVGVEVAVAVAVAVGVGVGVSPACAQYLPPVFTKPPLPPPPHTIISIISLPVHTAVCPLRAEGALVVLVAIQLPLLGLYLPPVLKLLEIESVPPQTIISLAVHTAVCPVRADGALVRLVAVQLSVLGLYLPPVFKTSNNCAPVPPQTIIWLPVHTAV